MEALTYRLLPPSFSQSKSILGIMGGNFDFQYSFLRMKTKFAHAYDGCKRNYFFTCRHCRIVVDQNGIDKQLTIVLFVEVL